MVWITEDNVTDSKYLRPSSNSIIWPHLFKIIFFQIYKGHTDIVRCISADPTGQWLASGKINIITGNSEQLQCCFTAKFVTW